MARISADRRGVMTSEAPAQLRRRRAASRRLPELGDGRRDPIDPPRPRAQPVTVRLIGSRLSTAEFDGGPRGALVTALRTLGVPYQRAATGSAWWCPAVHLDDVMALLESRGLRVVPTL